MGEELDSSLEKILTCENENLIKMGFSMVNRFCTCRRSGETVDHLLIHLSMSFELWSFIFRIFGVQWVLLEKVLDLLCGWQCCGPNSDIWNLSLYVWCGLYGGNEIGVFLKMWSACLLKYMYPSLVLFTSGLLYPVLLIVTLFTPS